MNWYLFAAAVFSFLIFLIHTVLGGREIARPLLQTSGLDPATKYVSYYCWHIVSIVLLANAMMFAAGSWRPDSLDVAWTATFLAAGFCILGLIVPPAMGQSYKLMPQGWLFLPVSLLGILGGTI